MSKSIKILAVLGQILFAWLYSSATNFCGSSSCSAKSYISFILIIISFIVLDLYFLKLYPKFKKIPSGILTTIVLLFPVLFYLAAIFLNAVTRRPLSVIIIGVILIIVSQVLWRLLARGIFSLKLAEYLALKSILLLILAIGFLIANLNFAISSYKKYYSPNNDVYVVDEKSTFINYKFR